jgi:dihydrofolate reductase
MSLGGYITGPNDSNEYPLGVGGDRLHEWDYGLESWRERHGMESGTRNVDSDVLHEAFRNTGSVVMGRRMFDLGETAWRDNPPFHMPVFVVTRHAQEAVDKEGGTSFSFVTGGVDHALEQAKAAANDKEISVAGGANVIQQFIQAGLLDEIQIHIAPVLLSDGRRLFDRFDAGQIELERTRVINSPSLTHIRYRIAK